MTCQIQTEKAGTTCDDDSAVHVAIATRSTASSFINGSSPRKYNHRKPSPAKTPAMLPYINPCHPNLSPPKVPSTRPHRANAKVLVQRPCRRINSPKAPNPTV